MTALLFSERSVALQLLPGKGKSDLPYQKLPDVLPGTKQLAPEKDRSIVILDNAHRFIEQKIADTESKRSAYWKRDLSSREAYESSVAPNRSRFMKLVGVEDKHKPLHTFKL